MIPRHLRRYREANRRKEQRGGPIDVSFLTICTRDRAHLFGEITDGVMRLNDAGRMVERIWKELPNHYPGIEIDAYVVMPDHIHGIIIVRSDRAEGGNDDGVNGDGGAALRGRPGTCVPGIPGAGPRARPGACDPGDVGAAAGGGPDVCESGACDPGDVGVVPGGGPDVCESGDVGAAAGGGPGACESAASTPTLHARSDTCESDASTSSVQSHLDGDLQDHLREHDPHADLHAPFHHDGRSGLGTSVSGLPASGSSASDSSASGSSASDSSASGSSASDLPAPSSSASGSSAPGRARGPAPPSIGDSSASGSSAPGSSASGSSAPGSSAPGSSAPGSPAPDSSTPGSSTPGRARGPAPGMPGAPASAPSSSLLTLPDIVGRFKSFTTTRYIDGVRRLGWRPFRGKVWQRGYFERIVWSAEALDRFRRYIAENPERWGRTHRDRGEEAESGMRRTPPMPASSPPYF